MLNIVENMNDVRPHWLEDHFPGEEKTKFISSLWNFSLVQSEDWNSLGFSPPPLLNRPDGSSIVQSWEETDGRRPESQTPAGWRGGGLGREVLARPMRWTHWGRSHFSSLVLHSGKTTKSSSCSKCFQNRAAIRARITLPPASSPTSFPAFSRRVLPYEPGPARGFFLLNGSFFSSPLLLVGVRPWVSPKCLETVWIVKDPTYRLDSKNHTIRTKLVFNSNLTELD